MKRKIIGFVVTVVVIALLYTINSIIIKPHCSEDDNWITYIMWNQFNDFLAGIAICTVADFFSLLILHKPFKKIYLYLLLWLAASFMWEILRPYVLKIFNPFHKKPKAKWGDVVAYGLGVLFYYAAKIIGDRG